MVQLNSNGELYHHGIEGQKHGIRRFQNIDGSLTPEGKIRYGVEDAKELVENKKVKEEPKKEEYKKEEAKKEEAKKEEAKKEEAKKEEAAETSTNSTKKKKKKGKGSGKKAVVKAKNGRDINVLRRMLVANVSHSGVWEYTSYGDVLIHHGIRGMKWGIRRWQNDDGSLTPAGYKHYGKHPEKATNEQLRQVKERANLEADIARSLGKQPGQKGFIYEKGKSLANKFIDKKIDQFVTKHTTPKDKEYDFTNLDPTSLTNPKEIADIAKAIKDIKSIRDTVSGMNKQDEARFKEDYNKFKNVKDSRDVLGKDMVEYEWFKSKTESYKSRKEQADNAAKKEAEAKKAEDKQKRNESITSDAKTQREARNYMNGMRDTLLSDLLKKK